MGQLDLQHALLGVGVLGEYVQDQRNSIDDVTLERLMQIALLCWREFVVKHNNIDIFRVRYRHELREFPFPDERCCNGTFPAHQSNLHGI